MKKIIFVKGPPGSGKSTLISQLGWDAYSLSMDTMRLLYRSPELDSEGMMRISAVDNNLIYSQWISLISSKMERGEFIVLDTVFADRPDDILKIANLNKYESFCIDLSNIPLDQILEQNEQRPSYKQVNSKSIERLWSKLNTQDNWPGVDTVKWNLDGSFKNQIQSKVKIPLYDFSSYKNIVHIGDLQGCFTVLTGEGGVLEDGFKDDSLYIFVGDLLDRGIENGKVLRWFVDEATNRDNVILIWGNHEDHLHRWSVDIPAVSSEFSDNTLPQLLEEGITKDEAKRVCDKAVEVLMYSYNGQRVMVCHAGLPTVPSHPELISSRQYSKGTGFWTDPIDEQFERNAPSDWIQVHGHRNHNWQEIRARPRSFNLEDQVEFGGRLRWAILNADGWSTGSNINKVYKLDNSLKIEKRKINWPSSDNKLSKDTANNLRNHEGVKERTMPNDPHISSFNFTKDVFFKSSWDDLVVKARGFFINQQTNEIVSRGYDKFFNIGERAETKVSELSKSLKFPVVGYLKENGFLGNVGYDSHTGTLFVATKSTNAGMFCDWFKDILDTKMSKLKQEGLARWLRDNNACMTFEVIDIKNDPHMIDYDQNRLILLDVFHRSEETHRISFEELQKVASKFDLEVKQRGVAFQNPEGFERWHEKVYTDITWRYHGKDIEGFVFEDTQGQMVKIKMANYAFWKSMRNQKDRMSRRWEDMVKKGVERNEKLSKIPNCQAPLWNESDVKEDFKFHWQRHGAEIHPAAEQFLGWCANLPASYWKKSIIELRDEFMKTSPDPSIFDEPYFQDPLEKIEYENKKHSKNALVPPKFC